MNGLYGQALFREAIDQCVSDWGQKGGNLARNSVFSWIQSAAPSRVVSLSEGQKGANTYKSAVVQTGFLGPVSCNTHHPV